MPPAQQQSWINSFLDSLICCVQRDTSIPISARSPRRTPRDQTPRNSKSRVEATVNVFDMDNLDHIFEACDTDGSGVLDPHEAKYGLQAFGFNVSADAILQAYSNKTLLSKKDFSSLIEGLRASSADHQRRPRAVPHSKRGMTFGQLQQLEDQGSG